MTTITFKDGAAAALAFTSLLGLAACSDPGAAAAGNAGPTPSFPGYGP